MSRLYNKKPVVHIRSKIRKDKIAAHRSRVTADNAKAVAEDSKKERTKKLKKHLGKILTGKFGKMQGKK